MRNPCLSPRASSFSQMGPLNAPAIMSQDKKHI